MVNIPTSIIKSETLTECRDWVFRRINDDNDVSYQITNNTKRQTIEFGYGYFSLFEGNHSFAPIPECFIALCKEFTEEFSEYNLPKYTEFQNVIISIYRKEFMLEPHVDVDVHQNSNGENLGFYFGEHVLGVVLQHYVTGQFYITRSPYAEEEKLIELNEETGTAFLLSGDMRHKPHYHGVSEVTDLRISVTYRTVAFLDEECFVGESTDYYQVS